MGEALEMGAVFRAATTGAAKGIVMLSGVQICRTGTLLLHE